MDKCKMRQKKSASIIINYIYNSAYEILRLLAPLITAPYISRVLGVEGIGVYSYTRSIATYFVLVGALGTSLFGQREIAFVQNDPEKRTEVFWQIATIRGIAACLCTVFYYFSFGISGQYAGIYRILTLEVLATGFDISWFFMGMENFKLVMIRNTIIKLLGIILVFALVKKPNDVAVYAACLTLPIFIGNISLWFRLPEYLVIARKPILPGIPKLLKPIVNLFLPQIAVEVYTVLDKTMIGLLSKGIDQVGYYTQAQKIIKIVLTIVTSLGTVMFPAMSSAYAQGKLDEIKKSIYLSFRFMFMIACALMFGICSITKEFVPIFFGKGYDIVAPLMVVISPILLIIGMSNVIGKQYLLPTKQQMAYTISICTGAGINVLLNLLLIPKYDAIGASVATVLAEIGVTGVQCWFVRKQLHLREYMSHMVTYLSIGAGMFAAVKLVGLILPSSVLSLVIMICVGVAAYLGGLALTKDELLRIGVTFIKNRKEM